MSLFKNGLGLIRLYSTVVENSVRTTLKASDSRKTYLVDMYTQMWKNNEIVLLAHHNNLLSTENDNIRKALGKIGDGKAVEFRKLKSSIFKYFLRASEHPDPASKAANRMIRRRKIRHPLESLLKGPTAALVIRDLDPKTVKEVVKVLTSQKEKLFIMGGKVGEDIMTLQDIQAFKESKSLPELRSELVGLLTLGAGGSLVRTLEATSHSLAMNLESHKNEMEKAAEPKSETEN